MKRLGNKPVKRASRPVEVTLQRAGLMDHEYEVIHAAVEWAKAACPDDCPEAQILRLKVEAYQRRLRAWRKR